MATIYDIAEKTGLSPATVSRVLSGKKTSPENNRKVLDAARELNYHNIAYVEPERERELRRMVQNKTILLIPGRNGTDGCYAAAQSLGYSIQLISAENIPQTEAVIRQQLLSGSAVGLITYQPLSGSFLEKLALDYPVVSLGSFAQGPQVHSVWVDPLPAAQTLLAEFEASQRRRLWVCTSGYRGFSLHSGNLRGLLSEHSSIRDIEDVDITQTFFSQAMGDHTPLVERILAMPKAQRPDALLVGNSVVASCLVNLLRIHGIQVPEEIAVASAIGGEHDRACTPDLTSVLPPYYELGYEAVRILDSLVCGKLVPSRVTYPHRIHFGGSTRPALGEFGETIE